MGIRTGAEEDPQEAEANENGDDGEGQSVTNPHSPVHIQLVASQSGDFTDLFQSHNVLRGGNGTRHSTNVVRKGQAQQEYSVVVGGYSVVTTYLT